MNSLLKAIPVSAHVLSMIVFAQGTASFRWQRNAPLLFFVSKLKKDLDIGIRRIYAS